MDDRISSEMFEVFVRLNELARKFDVSLGIPEFAMIGEQSTGKTTLICALTGEALGGGIRNQMGTKCPVKYLLRHSPDSSVLINKKPVEMGEVFSYIDSHMKKLDSIVQEELKVEISGPSCVNMTFTDLPGVVTDKLKEISDLINHYVNTPGVIPIFLVESQHDPERIKNRLHNLLSHCRSNISAGVLFCTRLDEKLRSINNVSELVNMVTSIKNDGGFQDVCFFSCRPELYLSSSKGDLPDNYEQRKEYFKNIQERDKQGINKWMEELEDQSGESIGEDIREKFGLNNAVKMIQRKWVNELEKTIVNVDEKLSNENDRITAKLYKNKEVLNNSNACRNDAHGVNTEFIELLRALYNNEPTLYRKYVQQNTDTVSTAPSRMHTVDGIPSPSLPNLKLTYEEEESIVARHYRPLLSKWRGYKKPSALMKDKEFMESLLATRMKEKLGPGASVMRALRIWGYMFMITEDEPMTVEDFIDLNAYGSRDQVTGFQMMKVIRAAVNKTTNTDVSGIDILASWIFTIFSRLPDYVIEIMNKSPVRKTHPNLVKFLLDECKKQYCIFTKDLLKSIQTKFIESYNEAFGFLQPHLVYSDIALIASIELAPGTRHFDRTEFIPPDQHLIPSERPRHGTSKRTETSARDSSRSETEVRPETSRRDSSKPETEVKPDTSKRDSSKPETDARPENIRHENSISYPIRRNISQLHIIETLHEFHRRLYSRQRVTTATFCTFPQQKFPPISEAEVGDFADQLNGCIRMFRHIIKGKLLLKLQWIIEEYFMGMFVRILDNKLEEAMTTTINQMSEYELRCKALVNLEGIKNECIELNGKLETIDQFFSAISECSRHLGLSPPNPTRKSVTKEFTEWLGELKLPEDPVQNDQLTKDGAQNPLLEVEIEKDKLAREVQMLQKKLNEQDSELNELRRQFDRERYVTDKLRNQLDTLSYDGKVSRYGYRDDDIHSMDDSRDDDDEEVRGNGQPTVDARTNSWKIPNVFSRS